MTQHEWTDNQSSLVEFCQNEKRGLVWPSYSSSAKPAPFIICNGGKFYRFNIQKITSKFINSQHWGTKLLSSTGLANLKLETNTRTFQWRTAGQESISLPSQLACYISGSKIHQLRFSDTNHPILRNRNDNLTASLFRNCLKKNEYRENCIWKLAKC